MQTFREIDYNRWNSSSTSLSECAMSQTTPVCVRLSRLISQTRLFSHSWLPQALVVFSLCAAANGQATPQSAPLKGPDTPASVLARIVPNDCHGPTPADFAAVQSALSALQLAGDTAGQIRALTLLATLEQETGDYNASLPYLQSGLRLAQQSGDQKAQVRLLALTGWALKETDLPSARTDLKDSYNRAGKSDPAAQAFALTGLAEVDDTSDPQKAADDLDQALPLAESAHDQKTKAIILADQASVYSEHAKNAAMVVTGYETALKFAQSIHDCREEAAILSNWANFNVAAGQESDALQQYKQALKIVETTGDRAMQAAMLQALGYFYQEMGDLDDALSNFRQSLQLEMNLGNKREEGPTMAVIAGVDRDAGNPSAALDDYRLALPVLQQTDNAPWQIIVLNNMGTSEADLGDAGAARQDYLQSIAAAKDKGDPITPAYSAWGLGELEQSDALPQYFTALRLAREYSQADLEGMVDASLMHHFHVHQTPSLAIFFGKRAVDQFQSIRRQMNGLANGILSSFVQKQAGAYRELAELLIEEGRLVEAQQVLDLLKVQQYANYVHKQPGTLSTNLARTPVEQNLQTGYDRLFSAAVAADAALQPSQGAASSAPTGSAQQAQQKALSDFEQFVDRLETQLSASAANPPANIPVTGSALSLQRLIAAKPNTVVLYTLLGADGFHIIVISAKGRVARAGSVAPSDLEKKCAAFLTLLSKGQDSTAVATDLFTAIIGPVQDDLRDAKADTLVWSLDGALRYIPVAALFDAETKTYLIDRYTLVNFTPLGRALEDVPRLAGATGIAMGVTQQYEKDLPLLPSVKTEVDAVIADPSVPGSHGVVPGTILLNGSFTREAMDQKVKSQAIVHVASHFVLVPGNDDLSFLLLGGDTHDSSGYHFPMADLANDQNLNIAGTRLMTLSACETGAENKRDDGVVMESLGELILDKGAESAISSLWTVFDPSTGALMADFYNTWVNSKTPVTKAAALRQAELDLLHGKVQPDAALKSQGVTSFSNPYYWAPFVLTGNWQ